MSYNMRNPAVKRLMQEAIEVKEPTEFYWAQPLEDNLFEWHFTVRGPPDTEFEGGVYHGRIIFPSEYPMKPPSIMLLTPNGRFETNKKICLSISGYHPETWQPCWTTRMILLAIIGFMPSHGAGAIGSLDYSADERRILAQRSQDWKCPSCNTVLRDILPPITEAAKEAATAESKKYADKLALGFKDEKEKDDSKLENVSQSTANATESPGELPSSPTSEIRQRNIANEVYERIPSERSSHTENRPQNLVENMANGNERAEITVGQNQNSGSLIMVVILSLMIAALLLRRFYIINEWRFYPAQN